MTQYILYFQGNSVDGWVLRVEYPVQNGWALTTGPTPNLQAAFLEVVQRIRQSSIIPEEQKQRLLGGDDAGI